MQVEAQQDVQDVPDGEEEHERGGGGDDDNLMFEPRKSHDGAGMLELERRVVRALALATEAEGDRLRTWS